MIFLERGGGGGGGGEEFGAGLSGLGSLGRLEMRRIAWKAGETVTALYIFSYTTLGQLLLFLSMVFVKDTRQRIKVSVHRYELKCLETTAV